MTVVASKYAPQPNQFYETPAWATEALMRHFGSYVSGANVWEPSAGNHKIVNVLARHCKLVVSSDIETYHHEHDFIFDFYDKSYPSTPRMDWIITNPPYGAGNRMAVEYARLALERADNVALLLTAKFDFGKTRTDLFRDNPRFAYKINLLDRLSFFDDKTGTEDHAWYVWLKDWPYQNPSILYEEMK